MRIERYPLTNSYYIIVFDGGKNGKYSLTNSNQVVEEAYLCNDFSNARFDLNGYRMFGKILEKKDSDFEKILSDAGYLTDLNPKDAFISFLNNQGFEVTDDTWLISPKPPKKLTGTKLKILFNLGNPDFNYGKDETRELDVYMTPITNTTKSVKFSVMIPEHIYNACVLDPNEDLRPKFKHLESESLSYLHAAIIDMANQAFHLAERERDAKRAKKVICINFNSFESTERDSYNFAYAGQKLSTNFNFYVCYFTGKEYYSFHKVDSGVGLKTTGVKGIIDNTISGHKSWIKTTPKVTIDWTQEREDFLLKLEGNFRKLSDNLNKFLKDLDSNKLDLLVANNELLKLNK